MFFGKVITSNQPFSFIKQSNSNASDVLTLSSVTLAPSSTVTYSIRQGDTSFYIKKGNQKFLVANLTKERNQVQINIVISVNDNVQLVTTGTGTIHVIGFFQPEADDQMFDYQEDSQELEEAENQQNKKVEPKKLETQEHKSQPKPTTPSPQLTQKPKLSQNLPSPATKNQTQTTAITTINKSNKINLKSKEPQAAPVPDDEDGDDDDGDDDDLDDLDDDDLDDNDLEADDDNDLDNDDDSQEQPKPNKQAPYKIKSHHEKPQPQHQTEKPKQGQQNKHYQGFKKKQFNRDNKQNQHNQQNQQYNKYNKNKPNNKFQYNQHKGGQNKPFNKKFQPKH